MSVRHFLVITCAWSLGISDYVLSTCFSGARIDLSAEDNAIALAFAECPSRPYAELIKSNVPGPSSSRSTRSAALRPSPPSTMKVPPVGPSAAKPTRGELLAQLEMVSRKPRSGKRKTSDSVKKDRLVLVKVPKLGASSSSSSTHVHKPEWVKAPIVLSSRSHSRSAAEAEVPRVGPLSSRYWWSRPLPSGTRQRKGLGHLLEGRKRRGGKIRNPKLTETGTLYFTMPNSWQAQSRPFLRILILRGRLCCPLMRLWPYLSKGSPP